MNLFDMPMLFQLISNFACCVLYMSSFTMIFCMNCWFIFHLIEIFDCCLAFLGLCLSACLPCLMKCSYYIIWTWNLIEWFITCLGVVWLWSHPFLNCFHCFMNYGSWCLCWCFELAYIIVSGFLDFHWPSSFCPIELKIDMLYLEYVLFRCELFEDFWNCFGMLLIEVILFGHLRFHLT